MALGSLVFFQGDFERAERMLRGRRDAGARRRRSRHDGRRFRITDDARRSNAGTSQRAARRAAGFCGGRSRKPASPGSKASRCRTSPTRRCSPGTSIVPGTCTSRRSRWDARRAISGESASSCSISRCCAWFSNVTWKPELCVRGDRDRASVRRPARDRLVPGTAGRGGCGGGTLSPGRATARRDGRPARQHRRARATHVQHVDSRSSVPGRAGHVGAGCLPAGAGVRPRHVAFAGDRIRVGACIVAESQVVRTAVQSSSFRKAMMSFMSCVRQLDQRRLRTGTVRVRDNREERAVVPQHILQRLRRVVVEVRRGVADPAQRRDLERAEMIERGRGLVGSESSARPVMSARPDRDSRVDDAPRNILIAEDKVDDGVAGFIEL